MNWVFTELMQALVVWNSWLDWVVEWTILQVVVYIATAADLFTCCGVICKEKAKILRFSLQMCLAQRCLNFCKFFPAFKCVIRELHLHLCIFALLLFLKSIDISSCSWIQLLEVVLEWEDMAEMAWVCLFHILHSD